MHSAVLLIIYKRESTTKRVFEAIRQAKPPRLYIAANAPNPGKDDDFIKCTNTRRCTEFVDWPCEVFRLYRNEHLSAGLSISSAITWFFENEEQGIILEDDILPNLEFFTYCDVLLDRYKNNPQIQLISGYNCFFDGYKSEVSYYMSNFLQIWGWASWRRVWQTYVYDTSLLNRKEYLRKLNKLFPRPVYRYYKDIFDIMIKQKNDTWDYQFFFNQVLHDRLSIIPYKNLIENLGLGSIEAVHITDTADDLIWKLHNHQSQQILPLVHPTDIHYDHEADNLYAKVCKNEKYNLLCRIIRKIINVARAV